MVDAQISLTGSGRSLPFWARPVALATDLAGGPAKPPRSRFATDRAARIEALAWWDGPVEKLARAVPDIQSMPIEAFLDRWQNDVV